MNSDFLIHVVRLSKSSKHNQQLYLVEKMEFNSQLFIKSLHVHIYLANEVSIDNPTGEEFLS